MWGDAGYKGVDKRAENRELEVEWQVAMKPGQRRQLEPGSEEALAEKGKASVRAKVEHPFLYVKRYFGYAKVRYRGLSKNTQRLALLLGPVGPGQLDDRRAPPGSVTGHSASKSGLGATTRPRRAASRPQQLRRNTTRGLNISEKPLSVHSIQLTPGCPEVPEIDGVRMGRHLGI